MKLVGTIETVNRAREGHSQVRVKVAGFGEAIFSAPKAQEQMAALMALPDDAELTITVEPAA